MKISVITTTYNRREYLHDAIESVQKSILTPFTDVSIEHIIYDDASTDGTEEYFKKINWPNVFYYRGGINRGPSFGRNYAVSKSTGDYIFLLDSDDAVLQRTLYHFSSEAKKYSNISWFISEFIKTDGDLKYLSGEDYYTWNFKDTKEMLEAIFKGEHFIQSNVFFKKELFEKTSGFDENMRIAEELDLFIRFLLLNEMPQFLPFISHLHRVHRGNISFKETPEKHKETVKELSKRYCL